MEGVGNTPPPPVYTSQKGPVLIGLSLRKDLQQLAGTEEDNLCDNAVKLIRHQLDFENCALECCFKLHDVFIVFYNTHVLILAIWRKKES